MSSTGVVGILLLLFGMRWLRKAILRAAGVIALHDEAAAYANETEALRATPDALSTLDGIAVLAAFKITMLEGIEVVFIIIALGAGGAGLLMPAIGVALSALAVVNVLGLRSIVRCQQFRRTPSSWLSGFCCRRSVPSGPGKDWGSHGRGLTGRSSG